MKKIILLISCVFSVSTWAESENGSKPEFSFKWDSNTESGRCLNAQGKEGYNPKHLGECGDLRGMGLSSSDLNGFNLDGALLDGLSLIGYNFNGASLRGIKANGTDFSRSHLNGANLSGADLSGANFSKSELDGSYFNKAKLSGAQFKDSRLAGAHFESAQLEGAHFNSSIKTVSFKNATYSAGTFLKMDSADYASRGLVPWEEAREIKKDKSAVPPERVPASK